MMGQLSYVVAYILLSFSVMFLTACSGMFDQVDLDLGMEHYAEPAWLPVFNIMPLNSLINFGYIGLGLYWCAITQTATNYGILKDKDSALFYTFNILATLYGGIQLLRIVTQSIVWSVLDQWLTFPFFSLCLVWGFYYQFGWSDKHAGLIMSISIFSYALSLCFKVGFEIALGFHIVSAVCGGVMAYKKHPAQGSLRPFFLGLICCLGFVVLKLLDHKLAEEFFILRYVSGHFLSKVCDIGQIHFANNFFFDLTLQKSADISIEKRAEYFQHCDTSGLYDNKNDIRYEVSRRLHEQNSFVFSD